MNTPLYKINKGINKPLEFKGLQAQYITWLAAGLCSVLLLFALLYLCGLPMLLCLIIPGILAACWLALVFHLNGTYGRYGLMKRSARRQVPARLVCRTTISLSQPSHHS
ncbi:DUF4133 domain-containing protein [Roseivirga sp. BDSF3-8]|uniref:DUF4133 domain-containing protein n=1 Tax=Roseivirga sp. BDSF3-8 TaxID=3241598 RepID=UPI003531CBED